MEPNDCHKELELIQSVINRMANNSFLIKGWSITLTSALLTFSKEEILGEHGVFYLLAILVVMIPFWWLDAFYLKQERYFRGVYKRAVNDRNEDGYVPYSMEDRDNKIKNEIGKQASPMFSHSTIWFYLPMIVLLVVGIILKLTGKL